MSAIAQELDETLRRIDPGAAERVTRLVRGILLLVEGRNGINGCTAPEQDEETLLLNLAAHAEPMGVLTNAEIDLAVYGR